VTDVCSPLSHTYSTGAVPGAREGRLICRRGKFDVTYTATENPPGNAFEEEGKFPLALVCVVYSREGERESPICLNSCIISNQNVLLRVQNESPVRFTPVSLDVLRSESRQ